VSFYSPLDVRVVRLLGFCFLLLLAPRHLQPPVLAVGFLGLLLHLLLPLQEGAVVSDLFLKGLLLLKPFLFDFRYFAVKNVRSVAFLNLHNLITSEDVEGVLPKVGDARPQVLLEWTSLHQLR